MSKQALPPTKRPQVCEIWRNNRNSFHYIITSLPLRYTDNYANGSDFEEAETNVVIRNLSSGISYVRSLHSFLGINRDGNPRFTFMCGAHNAAV